MRGKQAECLVEGVGGEGGARRAGLLPPNLLAIELQDRLGIVAQEAISSSLKQLGKNR
jgi:hypothetical protein